MENIKWYGNKKDFLNFAKDFVVNIHDRCRNPKDTRDHQLIKDMKDVEIQIVGTVNGQDILEIRFIKLKPKAIPTAEEFISNHYGEIYDRKSDEFKSFISREKYIFVEVNELGNIHGPEKSIKDLIIEFATMHVQACKEDIAGNIEYDPDHALHRQSILQSYPESNIR